MISFSRGVSAEVSRTRALFGHPLSDLRSVISNGPQSLAKVSQAKLSLNALWSSVWSELAIAAGVTPMQKQSWMIVTFAACASLLLFPVLVGMPMLTLLAVLPVAIFKFKLESRANSRAQNFEKDYAAFLLGLSSSIRTGLDPLQAMSQSAELFESSSEMGKALTNFSQEIERGVSEEYAIREFAGNIRHPDISMFRAGFMLSRKEGSSLAECLQRLARVTRQRQSFRRKMKSSVAMQRMSGFGIGGCSIVICTIQAVGNPQAFKEALQDPVGVKFISCGVILLVTGIFWMLRMTRTRM